MNRFAIALVCLFGCQPNRPLDPVVVILRDGMPVCSGFAVGHTQIVTAAHCVADRSSVAFVTADQWAHTARAFTVGRVTLVDSGRDLAAIESEVIFTEPLRMREPEIGEAVQARSLMFSRVTSGAVRPGVGYFRDTSMTIELGWSGSPVLGIDGSVVGFVHACEARWNGRPVCIPHSALIGVLP